jgi:lambda repressor-like predicted transcriptional regulator
MSTTLSAAMRSRGIGVDALARQAGFDVNKLTAILEAEASNQPWTIDTDAANRIAAALGYRRVYELFGDANLVAATTSHRGERFCTRCNNTIPLVYRTTCPHCNGLE